MNKNFFPISSLLLGIAILMLGNGPLPTYISVNLSQAGVATWIIGIVMSQYYFGFVIGPIFTQKLIENVGHIRAFVVFCTTMSAITLLHIFTINFIILQLF